VVVTFAPNALSRWEIPGGSVGAVGKVTVQRVREYVEQGDRPGRTAVFLVDRVWPRGLSKADVDADWVKDVGPSTELRKWFGHDPERWQEFTQRYRAELDEQPEVTAPLQAALEQGDVLLLFDAKDTEHNQAVVLADWLRDRADGR